MQIFTKAFQSSWTEKIYECIGLLGLSRILSLSFFCHNFKVEQNKGVAKGGHTFAIVEKLLIGKIGLQELVLIATGTGSLFPIVSLQRRVVSTERVSCEKWTRPDCFLPCKKAAPYSTVWLILEWNMGLTSTCPELSSCAESVMLLLTSSAIF